MSNYSEKELQQFLHQNRFYTQKAPSSGHGVMDVETEEYIDQADIVAIRDDAEISQYDGHTPLVLLIEEKHQADWPVYIEDQERDQLRRIQQMTGGTSLLAVQIENTQYPHTFFYLEDLVDTGQHWKIPDESSGKVLDDVT